MYGKPDKQSGAYQVGVQVSCGIYAKVPKEDHLQPVQNRFAGDHTEAVQVQRSGDSGREHDAGSRTSANKYTTKDERIRVSGALEPVQGSQSKEMLKVPLSRLPVNRPAAGLLSERVSVAGFLP